MQKQPQAPHRVGMKIFNNDVVESFVMEERMAATVFYSPIRHPRPYQVVFYRRIDGHWASFDGRNCPTLEAAENTICDFQEGKKV